jgi:FlaA1/EpsC-like NDP-sugar epimerase
MSFLDPAQIVISLPRNVKRTIVVIVDVILILLSVWLTYSLRVGVLSLSIWPPAISIVLAIAIGLPVFYFNGLYHSISRYIGVSTFIAILRASLIYGLIYAMFILGFGIPGVPRTLGIVQPILVLVFVSLSRIVARLWLGDPLRSSNQFSYLPKVLIYGAGSAGRQLATALANSYEFRVVGYLDDDERLHGQVLNGLKIYSPKQLTSLVQKLEIRDVLLAIPSASRSRRNEVLKLVSAAQVSVRTLPTLADMAQGRYLKTELKDLDIEDLLGREIVVPNPLLMGKNIFAKTVLVTGAGGSIGSELCRQIIRLSPSKLLLVEISEYALYSIHHDLLQLLPDNLKERTTIIPLLASVQDESRLSEIMSVWQPETVYHAAAYKHVPIVEHNPVQGIRNNVFGTLRTAILAKTMGVKDFILISTDKAVRPTNIMGASKRLAELVLQGLTDENKKNSEAIRYSIVRFGNVLGSSGSVVPLFRKQIKLGGPITITHPDMTRYFMTIPEAAQLTIQAGAMGRGGEVFVLDMGDPVRIIELAQRMIELSGLSVKSKTSAHGEIEISVIGMRPGEKLYEELLIGNNPLPTIHQRIMKANEKFIPWIELKKGLDKIECALEINDVAEIRKLLQEIVSGYVPDEEIVDWVYLEHNVNKQHVKTVA